eukprot:gnl/TRDRNA2_/TRDRNA2_177192_c1_seq1.p1 gnl/TRDRNA2_/TRDRNA2_177192_c1~~gnl/TRDRNA2_/TRDRNA2_177192_c1_seq1.p1  ORF type:complete len:110 (+),score=15.10 gnl/TRDRNA2_/TRDRNA2_177192_c1_seq1:37-330(+)
MSYTEDTSLQSQFGWQHFRRGEIQDRNENKRFLTIAAMPNDESLLETMDSLDDSTKSFLKSIACVAKPSESFVMARAFNRSRRLAKAGTRISQHGAR